MLYLYNILTYLSFPILYLIALFNAKIKLFVVGRQQSFTILQQGISKSDQVFWVHVASLGEYEQGLPLMEALKQQFPTHKIVLTFFSPSGYEVKKNNTIADVTIYLPLDTISNAKRFLKIAHPEKAFFVKYEYWPNYLNQLYKQNIPTFLVSGIFRPNQIFFKWYGGFYRKALQAFTYFFVQNEVSQNLLNQLGYTTVEIVGDTRFDRVAQILENNNSLDFLDQFTNNKQYQTIVIGSSWPQDEELLANYINNQLPKNVKVIFAPHNIKKEQIENLKNSLQLPTICYTTMEGKNLAAYDVLIIDAYSLLTKAYSYAQVAYIGGGFGAGIHNILEAATYGVPILIGPNYKKFQEAKDLITLGSCLVIHSQEELNKTLNRLLNDQSYQKELGDISSQFVLKNKDATKRIMAKL
ncbi:MAG: 3-deoxy-D-manno-octulosonic acid transferase [Flavobacteriaceae bacterium]|jgi:3-deoxy-D-manno-octulosonic-acid transferase|nr:3-deoxy-D-manno-octulosonic acid transferase [Flavobacteriaceae bacterium]